MFARSEPTPRLPTSVVVMCIAVLTLVLLFGGCAEDTVTAAGPTAIPTKTKPTPTPRPSPTATPFVLATIFHDSGKGDKLTTDFVVNDYWLLNWKCDRSSDYGFDYNVIIYLIDPLTGSSEGVIVNALCENGNTSGSEFSTSPNPGDFELQVLSEGWWDVTVQEDQPG